MRSVDGRGWSVVRGPSARPLRGRWGLGGELPPAVPRSIAVSAMAIVAWALANTIVEPGHTVPDGEPAVAPPAARGSPAASGADLVRLIRQVNRTSAPLAARAPDWPNGAERSTAYTDAAPPGRSWSPPAAGWISSHFAASRVHPILRRSRPHRGVDIRAPWGAPIVVPADGLVRRANEDAGYGRTLLIDHGGGVQTRYAHCAMLWVREGQRVSAGDVVALVGSTGLSTAPHLHYEVRVDGTAVDPLDHVW